ncbi:MAG: hypothetical protein RRY38_01765, partial [Oscillospiraceae bacterium]
MNKYGITIKGSGITRRWVAVSLLTTIVILISASVAVMLALRQNYYSLVRQALEYRISSTMKLLPSSNMPTPERVSAVRCLVEDFDEKNKL